MKRRGIVLTFVLFGSMVVADDHDGHISDVTKLRGILTEASDLVRYFQYKQYESCAECTAYAAGEATADPSGPLYACKRAWDDFYSKSSVEIRLAFGYTDSDARQTSDDRVFRAALVEQLMAPCTQSCDQKSQICEPVKACGFKRSASDSDIIEKEIEVPSGRKVRVNIRLKTSVDESYSQAEASARAEEFFLDGLVRADAVFYLGHARGGGGPSFGPSHRRADGGIDLQRHRQDPIGYKKMRDKLSMNPKTAKIIGIMACDSRRLFENGLLRSAPESGLILTPAADNGVWLVAKTFYALDSILSARCEGGFNEAMNAMELFQEEEARISEQQPKSTKSVNQVIKKTYSKRTIISNFFTRFKD